MGGILHSKIEELSGIVPGAQLPLRRSNSMFQPGIASSGGAEFLESLQEFLPCAGTGSCLTGSQLSV